MVPQFPPQHLTTCVIGGAGFIGRAVVADLLARGHQVVVVGRQEMPPADMPVGVRYFHNPQDSELDVLREALQQCDSIVDLAYATIPGTSFQDPVRDILLNVPETVRLFDLASAMPQLKKFVWVSSGGTVYGRTAAGAVDETQPTQPLSPYGITKLALEKYAHMYFEIKQLPIVCVRPANAYGEGQIPYRGQGFIATAIASILDGRELTLFGEQGTIRDYLHVTDMAAGIVAALEAGTPGEVYNIGSGSGLTNRQLLDMLAPWAERISRPLQLRIQPSRPFDVPVNILDSSRLTQDTGWAPRITIETGLLQTWQWYVEQSVAQLSKQEEIR